MELVKVKTWCQEPATADAPREEAYVSDPPVSALLTCPDCGGILEPTRPAWATAIEIVVAAEPADAKPTRWKCLICGFHADSAPAGDGA